MICMRDIQAEIYPLFGKGHGSPHLVFCRIFGVFFVFDKNVLSGDTSWIAYGFPGAGMGGGWFF
jgi:hypothetical protein